MAFDDDSLLPLSGLQHFAFCRRQWALIHIEHQWAENYQTADGRLMHETVHNPSLAESRGSTYICRGVAVQSYSLGISGQCDVLEYHRSDTGIPLPHRDGLWQPYPVEYKRGSPKSENADRLQLCAQALCLEEMLCCAVPKGSLFYGETRRREEVVFSEELRAAVKASLSEMHALFQRGYTPRVKPAKACRACSLKELCLPRLMRAPTVSAYLAAAMEEPQ